MIIKMQIRSGEVTVGGRGRVEHEEGQGGGGERFIDSLWRFINFISYFVSSSIQILGLAALIWTGLPSGLPASLPVISDTCS